MMLFDCWGSIFVWFRAVSCKRQQRRWRHPKVTAGLLGPVGFNSWSLGAPRRMRAELLVSGSANKRGE